MWHSSSAQVWQNRWDGGEGYKDMFLRRSYPVYLWGRPAGRSRQLELRADRLLAPATGMRGISPAGISALPSELVA